MIKRNLVGKNSDLGADDKDAMRWRLFTEYFDGLVIITDSEGAITFISGLPKGADTSKMLGAKASDWVNSEDRAVASKGFKYVIESGGQASFEIRAHGFDNAESWYRVKAGPIRDGDRIVGLMALCSNITEAKRILEEAEGSKSAMVNLLEDINKARIDNESARAKADAILLNIGDGLAVVDASGRVEIVNGRLCDMMMRQMKDLVGKSWTDVLRLKYGDGKDVPPESNPTKQVLNLKTKVVTAPVISESMRYFLPRSDGKATAVQITASPIIADGKITGVVSVFRDVARELELERIKTEFVSIASHQLRTPLSTVNWYSEMLLSNDVGSLNEKQQDYMKEIYQGNQRMIDLVNALLNVSRLEVGAFIVEPTQVDTKEVVHNVIKDLDPQLKEHGIKMEETFDKNLPKIQADYSLVHMILQNLVTNAIKYTSTKVGISLSLQDGVLINSKDRKDLSGVLIKVYDDGMGIPEAQKERVFTKLFRADNARMRDPAGSGLGLYIIKSIIDQTGGEIWFDSEENKGTTFYVLAPISWMEKRSGTRKLIEK